LARKAPAGVIFRRGPSRWVQLIKWNTAHDTFDEGQWFHGHIYVRRSDVSPNGCLLIYFANKFNRRTLADKQYSYAWTAISRPPFLTALALWPKGDCWHGGGLFRSDQDVWLNHRPADAEPHPNHRLKGVRVQANPEAYGEDDPVFVQRMERDGWVFVQGLENASESRTNRPVIWEKQHHRKALTLRVQTYYDPEERWLCSLLARRKEREIGVGTWADFDQQGRLVFASDGALFAGVLRRNKVDLAQLADFNQSKPRALKAPAWASRW
jgi:hypothetical protein